MDFVCFNPENLTVSIDLFKLFREIEHLRRVEDQIKNVKQILKNTDITGEQLRFQISRALEVYDEQVNSSGKV